MPATMQVAGYECDEAVPGAAVVLEHPAGGKVYLVAVSHAFHRAPKDVADCILATNPAVIALEIDQERYKRLQDRAASGDPYDMHKFKGAHTPLQTLALLWNGKLFANMVSQVNTIWAALVGIAPGSEFLTAADLSRQVGAEVRLIDRDQKVTMARMVTLTQQLQQQGQPAIQLPQPPGPHAGAITEQPGLTGDQSDSLDSPAGQESSSFGSDNLQPQSPPGAQNPAGSGSRQDMAQTITLEWRNRLRSGGCDNADEVVDTFKRMLQEGSKKGGRIGSQDLSVVRGCARKVVESERRKALQGGSEEPPLSMESVQRAAGLPVSSGVAALKEVIGHERDMVLARRLWEAGQAAKGGNVVGVVGASHCRGIAQHWVRAGTPAMAHEAEQYCQAPQSIQNPVASRLGWILAGSGLAYLTYKRPRAVLVVGGTSALFSTAVLYSTIGVAIQSATRFADNIVEAASSLEMDSSDVTSWS